MANPTVFGDTGTGTCLLGHSVNPVVSVTTFVSKLSTNTFVGGLISTTPSLSVGKLVLFGSEGLATCGHTTTVVENSLPARVIVNNLGIQCAPEATDPLQLGGGTFPLGTYLVDPVTGGHQMSVRISSPLLF